MTDRLPDVPMKAITIRLGDDAYDKIAQAAADEGVSFSQYLRESALARVWFTHGYKHDDIADERRALLAICRAADDARIPLDEYVRRLLGP